LNNQVARRRPSRERKRRETLAAAKKQRKDNVNQWGDIFSITPTGVRKQAAQRAMGSCVKKRKEFHKVEGKNPDDGQRTPGQIKKRNDTTGVTADRGVAKRCRTL